MNWPVYLTVLVYYLLGTTGIYLINRKRDRAVKRKAWTKLFFAFVFTNTVYFSIVFDTLFSRLLTMIVIPAGFYELYSLFSRSGRKHTVFFIAALSVMVMASAGFYAFSYEEEGLIMFTFLILSIFDGFSQITGQLFGKRKLFPKVSEGKTVEGLAGGILTSLLSAVVFRSVLPDGSYIQALATAAIVILFAFGGDAAKSVYKRKYGVKDFNNLIPGHGGILDRFDSLIGAGAGIVLSRLLIDLL